MPEIYGFSYFLYNPEKAYNDILREKCQYTYRFMFFASGATNMMLGSEIVNCTGGDVVLILPGEKYTLMPTQSEFFVVNVFFDFFHNSRTELCGKENVYVYPENFRKELGSPIITFSDIQSFNKSGIFKKICSTDKIKYLLSVLKQDNFGELYAKTFILSVICDIITHNLTYCQRNKKAEEIAEYIRANINTALNAETLANIFGYHKNYINHLIKNYIGLTLSAFIRKEKILSAKSMLTEAQMSCTDIAQELGYYDFSHFYKAFVAETGISPHTFAKRQNGI